ncbi:hypothetical protein OE88DRAFT_1660139 [Heliocybe sulcata]|uniref:Uncharacterized protein n=1 Tax=Heliocybe sulcata TaxID=5364 RepID=A0A5C3N1B7_9AGAM|nr:hypothetical protein OE88DRAFT_1660139 [Heliocybe sulcata]
MALSCPSSIAPSAIPVTRMDSLGRPDRMPPPIDMSWRAPDPDVPLQVCLRVSHTHSLQSRSRHWAIFWDVPYQDSKIRANRILHVVADQGKKIFVNYGPLTKFVSEEDRWSSRELALGVINLTARHQLEVIASRTPTSPASTDWNGQDWVEAVLREAVLLGLLSRDPVESALISARAA